MKKKTFLSLLIFAMLFTISCESSIEPQSPFEFDFTDGIAFCSHLSLENIHKTIPLINDFLSKLPEEMKYNRSWEHKKEIFEILVTGLNSLPCNVNARVRYGIRLVGWGEKEPFGVEISVMDNNGIMRELEIDFAIIEHNGVLMQTFAQIEGFSHIKQDRVFVATNGITINRVFDLINSLSIDALLISNGVLVSTLPPDRLQDILESLNSRPYTSNENTWKRTSGYVHALTGQITIFPALFHMNNKDYQADWLKAMVNYQLNDNTGYIITFQIPEGTGKEWETKFEQYDFVSWAERSYSTHRIR